MGSIHSVATLSHTFETLSSNELALVAQWAIAAVFAVSGVAKLRRPAHAAIAIARFGLATRTREMYGFAAGLAEIAVATALGVTAFSSATSPARQVATVVAALALAVFAVLIAKALLRGEHFPCSCFGAGHDALSGRALGRTMALALVALLAVLGSYTAGDLEFSAHQSLLAAVVGVGLISSVALMGAFARLCRSPAGGLT